LKRRPRRRGIGRFLYENRRLFIGASAFALAAVIVERCTRAAGIVH
jgi:hypothetical protein